ncbi:MAG: polysaccharide pyruvyl transferase family protein [Candidatus Omnitrophica bacterium]|nr:polysaccharide pyruvyl transferase family protein [Candidatus Omnitrophota bacterium]
MVPPKISATDLILSLQKKIEEVLKPLIPTGASVALFDFPDHPNVGDSAIWLGEKAFLKSLGVKIVYSCSAVTYSKAILSNKLRDGIILISGGGNLGDLWPKIQEFRERVVLDFPNNKIVQLPQSIFFKGKGNLLRAKRVFNSHPNLILVLRDQQSLNFARNEFSNSSFLCPDMAFALGSLNRDQCAKGGMARLLRSDLEASGANLAESNGSIEKFDWVKDRSNFSFRVNKWVLNVLSEFPKRLSFLQGFRESVHDRLAFNRLSRGISDLRDREIIITDRLHGHILSLLLGVPNIVMDNSYGKVRSFFETWTKDCAIAFWANSPEEAHRICEERL